MSSQSKEHEALEQKITAEDMVKELLNNYKNKQIHTYKATT